MKKKISEADLCKIIASHFAHGEIYNEVPAGGGYIDMVVVDKPLVIAIEAKSSLSMQVIEQAISRLGMAHYVYVATPVQPTHSQIAYLQHFGIGALYVNTFFSDNVIEKVKPRLFRKIKAPQLLDYMKQSVAGSQHQRTTAFGHFVNELHRQLAKYPNGATYKQVFDERTYTYYRTFSTFKSNVYQYVRRGVITGVDIEKGILKLMPNNDEG